MSKVGELRRRTTQAKRGSGNKKKMAKEGEIWLSIADLVGEVWVKYRKKRDEEKGGGDENLDKVILFSSTSSSSSSSPSSSFPFSPFF